MNWKRFKYITWPTFYHKWLGLDMLDDFYSYWHLNIKKRPHYWLDADPTDCPRKWCRYCGKGTNPTNNPQKGSREQSRTS